MPTRTFTAVIPVIPKHHKHVLALLKELDKSQPRFNKIIIVGSSQTEATRSQLQNIVERIAPETPIEIKTFTTVQTAGQNRNIGFEAADSDYVSFLDADDSYNPKRLIVLNKVIDDSQAELILHDYFLYTPFWIHSIRKIPKRLRYIQSEVLKHETFGESGRDRAEESGPGMFTNLRLPVALRRFHRIQHGHATVKRSITHRYSSRPVGEDGEFARSCLEAGVKVVYLPIRLSNYERPTVRGVSNAVTLRLWVTLASIKRKISNKYFQSRNVK